MQTSYDVQKTEKAVQKVLVDYSPHVRFLADHIADLLEDHLADVMVSNELPERYDSKDLYFILAANAFDLRKLPPGNMRVLVQLEQSSSAWFTRQYLDALRDSLAVFEYNLMNIAFLSGKGVALDKIWHLPPGARGPRKSAVNLPAEKRWDLIFFGDLRSLRRVNMLRTVESEFNLKIVTETFGEDLYRLVRQARFVLNIHYYMPPSLEIFRLLESISVGVPVISEDTPDSFLYKDDLKSSVIFFETTGRVRWCGP